MLPTIAEALCLPLQRYLRIATFALFIWFCVAVLVNMHWVFVVDNKDLSWNCQTCILLYSSWP